MLPMWMNFLLRTYAWMTILENNGLINKFLGLFGIGPLQMINTQGAVILGMVYNYLPFMILPIYTIMCQDRRTTSSRRRRTWAQTRFQVLARVVIPLSLPGVSTGITMVFVPAISTFIISKMLGGGSNQLDRRHHRAAVSGQRLQPQPRLGHLAGADGGGAAVHEHHEQL